MKYFGVLIFIIISCKNENNSVVIWENDKYECTVEREIFNNRLDNYLLAKNKEGKLAITLNQKLTKTTRNVWALAKDEETKFMLENWRNRFYWNNNLTFIEKSSSKIIPKVTEEVTSDFTGEFDLIIIETDTLFKARTIIY